MIREAIAALVDGRSLTEAEAAALLRPEAQASAWAGKRESVGCQAKARPSEHIRGEAL
jgi:hypothetical protein